MPLTAFYRRGRIMAAVQGRTKTISPLPRVGPWEVVRQWKPHSSTVVLLKCTYFAAVETKAAVLHRD